MAQNRKANKQIQDKFSDREHLCTLLHELIEVANQAHCGYAIRHDDLTIIAEVLTDALIKLGVNPKIEI